MHAYDDRDFFQGEAMNAVWVVDDARSIRWVLENERWFREYVVRYTNAANVLREDYVDAEDNDGLFSGYDPDGKKYEIASWQYVGMDDAVPAAGHKEVFAEPGAGEPGRAGPTARWPWSAAHRSG